MWDCLLRTSLDYVRGSELWLFVEDITILRSSERVVIWDIRSFGLGCFNLLSVNIKSANLSVCVVDCLFWYLHLYSLVSDRYRCRSIHCIPKNIFNRYPQLTIARHLNCICTILTTCKFHVAHRYVRLPAVTIYLVTWCGTRIWNNPLIIHSSEKRAWKKFKDNWC